MVTPQLFAAYPDAASLAGADVTELEQIVRSTGFFQTKARNLVAMGHALVDRFGGEVPTALDDLVTLPGVGRKTANVVRSVAFGLPGLPVDTHVGRLSRRLGLTTEDDPVKVELELNSYLPPGDRGPFSLRTILHGRRVCDAKKPRLRSVRARGPVPLVAAAARATQREDLDSFLRLRTTERGSDGRSDTGR